MFSIAVITASDALSLLSKGHLVGAPGSFTLAIAPSFEKADRSGRDTPQRVERDTKPAKLAA